MTPQDCQLLQDRLKRAEQAYEDLQLGKSVRTLVDQNGERVEFSPANAPRLAAYIQQLKSQLATECGMGARPTTGPMRFFFP